MQAWPAGLTDRLNGDQQSLVAGAIANGYTPKRFLGFGKTSGTKHSTTARDGALLDGQ